MKYLLRNKLDDEHLAKKFEPTVLTHVVQDGSGMAVSCSVMWALVCAGT